MVIGRPHRMQIIATMRGGLISTTAMITTTIAIILIMCVLFVRERDMEVSFQQLYQASRNCRKGKRKGLPCQRYEARLIDNLFDTQRALHLKQWQPKASHCFIAHNGNKPREIYAAHYADRVIHHYLIPRLEAIIAPKFIYDSTANQKYKGTHFGIQRVQKMMRQQQACLHSGQTVFYMQLDVHNFFYSIDKDILLTILARHLKKAIKQQQCSLKTGRDYYWLSHQILQRSHPIIVGNNRTQLKKLPAFKRLCHLADNKGLPIGNLSSQFFANVYLNELDQFIKHQLKIAHYVRYVDDFIILATSREQLQSWQRQINLFLEQHLKLSLNPKKIIQPIQQGVDFLGYIIRPHYKLVRRRVLHHFYQKLKHWQQCWCYEKNKGLVIQLNPEARQALHSLVASYSGHLLHAQAHKAWQQKVTEFSWLAYIFNLNNGHLQHYLWLKKPQRFYQQWSFFTQVYQDFFVIMQKGHGWVISTAAFEVLPKVITVRHIKSLENSLLLQGCYEVRNQHLPALLSYYQCYQKAYLLVKQEGYSHNHLRQRKLNSLFIPLLRQKFI